MTEYNFDNMSVVEFRAWIVSKPEKYGVDDVSDNVLSSLLLGLKVMLNTIGGDMSKNGIFSMLFAVWYLGYSIGRRN